MKPQRLQTIAVHEPENRYAPWVWGVRTLMILARIPESATYDD